MNLLKKITEEKLNKMTGYEIYCICRSVKGWKAPELKSYLQSNEKGYFEMVKEYFNNRKISDEDISNFIRCNFNKNVDTFDPFKLNSDEYFDNYITWKKTESNIPVYFLKVEKSVKFIENFCINNNITFENYKKLYAVKHIRQDKIDGCVVVYLNLINTLNLSTTDKFLLKTYLKNVKIYSQRLYNPELKNHIADLVHGMKEILEVNKLLG